MWIARRRPRRESRLAQAVSAYRMGKEPNPKVGRATVRREDRCEAGLQQDGRIGGPPVDAAGEEKLVKRVSHEAQVF